MNRKVVITISREYGSGGRELGNKIGKKLNIPVYDKEILKNMICSTEVDEGLLNEVSKFIEKDTFYIKRKNNRIISTIGELGVLGIHEKMFDAQKKMMLEVAKESCVIIGRCSGHILKDEKNVVRVFVRANLKEKKERVIDLYNEDEKELSNKLMSVDTDRANYYKYFTNEIWGKPSNYDLVINTSKLDVDKAADVVITYANNIK